jgi:tetratricopeptide (TPR) repeat protein
MSRRLDTAGNNGGKLKNPHALLDSIEELFIYVQEELPSEIRLFILKVVIPLIIAYFLLHGSLGILGDLKKLIFPPNAKELHRSALGVLHHNKRRKRDEEALYKEAEALLRRAIDKDESYFPAYLSLASLYIYRMQQADKAMEVLNIAKDVGPITKVQPLLMDAKALKQGDLQMVKAGGAIFQEQEYLSYPADR